MRLSLRVAEERCKTKATQLHSSMPNFLHNQPIFEKYKCVNFPMFAEWLGEAPPPEKSAKFGKLTHFNFWKIGWKVF